MNAAAEQIETGIFYDVSNDAYHASPGISNSGLAAMDQSPYHYYSLFLNPLRPPRKPKPGQLEGTIAHCAILEPDELDKRYVATGLPRRGTNAWKAFEQANPGREVVKDPEYTTAKCQAASIWALPDVAEALSNGTPEVSAYWNDPETGVLCRCRPDFVHNAGSGVVLLDVKTYSDASPAEFARQIARKGYHRQAAFYSDGYELASGQKVLAFIFVAVEAEWPFAACAQMLDDESLNAGRRLYRRNLDLYAQCLANDRWASYSDAIELVSLPKYAMENY